MPEKKFRLYYISLSNESQSFIVVIEDNFGNSYEMEFEFNASSDDDEEEEDSTNGGSDLTLVKLNT